MSGTVGRVMHLAKPIHVLKEEKKKLGLTENIWYCAVEEVCLRGSWQANKERQEEGTCGGLEALWECFFLAGRSYRLSS